jgi:hypothetical protein
MDEIGQVITAYNKMIRQNNILMKEKIFYETREQELRALKTRRSLRHCSVILILIFSIIRLNW